MDTNDNHSLVWILPCVYRSRRIATPSSLVYPSQAKHLTAVVSRLNSLSAMRYERKVLC
nr:MAG TPA: hypothetical protein [Caudoviricetes sp.]